MRPVNRITIGNQSPLPSSTREEAVPADTDPDRGSGDGEGPRVEVTAVEPARASDSLAEVRSSRNGRIRLSR